MNNKKSIKFTLRGKPENIVTAAVFLILLLGISAVNLFTPQKTVSETENRNLQTLPEFSFSQLFSGEFTKDFEDYVQDQFLLRDKWISAKNSCELIMQKKEINDIFLAADGYYIEDHKSANYKTDLAENNISSVAQFTDKYCSQLGAEHISVMIVPTAQSVLRDKLPSPADPYDQSEFISGFEQKLPQGVFVDVTQTLREHKDEEIYYRTDHHWTTYGAYLAYTQWARAKGFTVNPPDFYSRDVLTDSFLGTINSKLNLPMKPDTVTYYHKPGAKYFLTYENGQKTTDSIIDESFLKGKDKYGAFFGGNASIVRIETENKNGKTLVIFKDSYANCFVPLIADEFETVCMIDLRYYNSSVSELINSVGATDIMVLYNADSAATDMNLRKIAY